LWEFDDYATSGAAQDIALDAEFNPVAYMDEDSNGEPDLGYTWSTPLIGRIQIDDGTGAKVDKYVAIFGGGATSSGGADTTDFPETGNWLYMVDIETGRAIYKRQVKGTVPSQIAAVDTNEDGILDRVYFGTTAGLMYRIDLGPDPTAAVGSGRLPVLETVTRRATDGSSYGVLRLEHYGGNGSTSAWAPKVLFSTKVESTGVVAPRPIYFQPTVIFVARLGLYAISFGTGDRQNMWLPDNRPGRFYFFVDDSSDVQGNPLAGFTEPLLRRDQAPADSSQPRRQHDHRLHLQPRPRSEGMVLRAQQQRARHHRHLRARRCGLRLHLRADGADRHREQTVHAPRHEPHLRGERDQRQRLLRQQRALEDDRRVHHRAVFGAGTEQEPQSEHRRRPTSTR
jgi:hypothetical protein